MSDKNFSERIEIDYSYLNLQSWQRHLIADYAKIYGKHLPISEMEIKGLIFLTMRDFQVKTHLEVWDAIKTPSERRNEYLETLQSMFVEKLSKILPKQDRKDHLFTAIQETKSYNSLFVIPPP